MALQSIAGTNPDMSVEKTSDLKHIIKDVSVKWGQAKKTEEITPRLPDDTGNM